MIEKRKQDYLVKLPEKYETATPGKMHLEWQGIFQMKTVLSKNKKLRMRSRFKK